MHLTFRSTVRRQGLVSTVCRTLPILTHELTAGADRPIHGVGAVTTICDAGTWDGSRTLVGPGVILAGWGLDTLSCAHFARAIRTYNIAHLRAGYLGGAVIQISHASTAIGAPVVAD